MAGTVDPSVYAACSFGSSGTVTYFALSKPASCVPKIKLLIVKSIINELPHFEGDTLTIDTRFTIFHFIFKKILSGGSLIMTKICSTCPKGPRMEPQLPESPDSNGLYYDCRENVRSIHSEPNLSLL